MKNSLIISSIILSISIISGALIITKTPLYSYEKILVSEGLGFTVRIEAKSGERCLMIEGVLSPKNYNLTLESFQSSGFPIPRNICADTIGTFDFEKAEEELMKKNQQKGN